MRQVPQGEEPDFEPRPGADLRLGTLSRIMEKLLEQNLLFRLGDEAVARHVVSYFYPGNAWKATIDELRETLANLPGAPDNVPSAPEAFVRWVREDLLDLKYLPRDKLAELYEWASTDLAEIAANIAHCEAKLAELRRITSPTEDHNSKVRFYEYFINENRQAHEELVEVLTTRIHMEALRAAQRPFIRTFDFHVPWEFRWYPARFSPENYSPVAHAFGRLSGEEFQAVKDLYNREQWAEFDRVLAGYVAANLPLSAVRKMLREHHLLDARRAVLEPALNAFERGELALFASIAAIQVEGIIEDACYLSGVELRGGSIVTKVEALARKDHVRLDVPYYSFHFAALRNTVAHGRHLPTELRRTANLLLLDLEDVCELVAHHPGCQNSILKFLRDVSPAMATGEQTIEFATLYCECHGKPPDAFYGLATEFAEWALDLERPPFWEALEQARLMNSADVDSGLRSLAEGLRSLRPAVVDACGHFVKLLGGRGHGKYDRHEFLDAIGISRTLEVATHDLGEIRTRMLSVLAARERWQRIAEAAYLRWQSRGREPGRELEDWLAAEQVVLGRDETMRPPGEPEGPL